MRDDASQAGPFDTQDLKFNTIPMQELISRLKAEAHLTDEQALQVLATVKEYVKEKFPMLAGAVDNLLGGNSA